MRDCSQQEYRHVHYCINAPFEGKSHLCCIVQHRIIVSNGEMLGETKMGLF